MKFKHEFLIVTHGERRNVELVEVEAPSIQEAEVEIQKTPHLMSYKHQRAICCCDEGKYLDEREHVIRQEQEEYKKKKAEEMARFAAKWAKKK